MYRDSVDAFRQLLLSADASQIYTKVGCMQNGIAYCIVQVSLVNGQEYLIEAYDKEGEELYNAAKEHSTLFCLH